MPGIPPFTTPDNLPRIGDSDSPDIPRDMNALADATQVALSKFHGARSGREVRATTDVELPNSEGDPTVHMVAWETSDPEHPGWEGMTWSPTGIVVPADSFYIISTAIYLEPISTTSRVLVQVTGVDGIMGITLGGTAGVALLPHLSGVAWADTGTEIGLRVEQYGGTATMIDASLRVVAF